MRHILTALNSGINLTRHMDLQLRQSLCVPSLIKTVRNALQYKFSSLFWILPLGQEVVYI